MLETVAPLISRLASGQSLSTDEIADTFEIISREDSDGYYYLAFAVGLMARGPTTAELLGLVKGLQRFARPVPTDVPADQLIDVSGSGGDSIKTFNVSTATALVVAACGQYVVKQSFRAFTSYSGSSDVLQDVGVTLPERAEEIARLLDTVGIAPVNYATSYPGMEPRLAATVKLRELGLQFPTPMHPVALIPCPVNLKRRLYGLYTPSLLRPIAEIFRSLGYSRAMVVYGEPGLDEVSTLGPTHVCELSGGDISEYQLSPADLGLRRAVPEEVAVPSREASTDVFLQVLMGRATEPRLDLVAANAGAALYVCGSADTPKMGVSMARECIASGRALAKLRTLVVESGGQIGLEKFEARLRRVEQA